MLRTLAAFSATLLCAPAAQALCFDNGQPIACMIQGHPGERECVGGHITACIPNQPIPPPPRPSVGLIAPDYLVLSVIYAPPGTKGGNAASTVSYASGSTTGTTTGVTHSLKSSYSVSAKASGGFLGTGTSIGVSFGFAGTSSDGRSIEIKKSATTTIKDNGPASDGINHDADLIYLWLNPQVQLTVTTSAVAWTFAGSGPADIQFVYVSWLKNPDTMPAGVAQALSSHGITPATYPTIMARDPFANGDTGQPGPRFVSLNTTFPYEPPRLSTDQVVPMTVDLASDSTTTTTGSLSDDYTVGLSLGASAGLAGVTVAVDSKNEWTWSNSSSHSDAAGTTEKASVTVAGPSFGYTGSTDMQVYYDTLYKSFLFRPVDGSTPAGLRGRLVASNGTPIAFQKVTAVSGSRTFHTFTDAAGNYRFYGGAPGTMRLQADTRVQSVTQLRTGVVTRVLGHTDAPR